MTPEVDGDVDRLMPVDRSGAAVVDGDLESPGIRVTYAGLGERTASSDDVGTQVLLGGTRAKLLARGDQNRAATALANRSVKAAAETDYLMLHGEALCDRAEVHALAGRRPQAISDLDEAVAIFERKGITSLAGRARELRRELAEQAAVRARAGIPARI